MNLGQYINKLLPEYDTVIIPGFGALVSKYKPAEIDSETGEITPPAKEISFQQLIQNNDGLLVNYITESESVSSLKALKIVEEERENIIYQLDKGEKVLLEEVGEFFLNEKNEIQFLPLIKENLLLDSFGLEPVNLFEEFEEEEHESEFEKTNLNIQETKVDITEISDTQPEKETDTKEQSELSPESIENNLEIESVIDPPVRDVKKKTGMLWFLLLLIPIAIVAFVVFNNKQNKVDEQEKQKNSGILIEKHDAVSTIDSAQNMAADSVMISDINLNSEVAALNDSAKFYLVGGSFKEEENAQKFIENFNVEGYEPFYMGKIGNFHIVGLGQYNTEQEAYKAKNDYVGKTPESGTWIYEKR